MTAPASSVLAPYHGVNNPAGQQAALLSASDFLLKRYERGACDSPAVADCVRCNAVYLAKTMQRLAAPTTPAGKVGE